MSLRKALIWAAGLSLLAGGAAAEEPDIELGEEIYEICAPCHGPNGQGGGGGVYPRLAGMPIDYLSEQLRDFKKRVRTNIPMLPYATDRELSDEDILHVSAFLNQVRLATKLPKSDEAMDGLERLNQLKNVLQIPLAEGDVAKGKAHYDKACGKCHGEDGFGHKKAPGLAGQHVPYMIKQIQLFVDEDREHRDAEDLFGDLDEAQIQDLMAYLTTLDDGLDY